MRISLYVANYPPVPCGVGDYTYKLVKYLGKMLGSNIQVYSSMPEDSGNRQRSAKINGLESMKRFVDILKKDGTEVLILQYQSHSFNRSIYPNLLVAYLRLFSNIKTILVMHDFAGPTLKLGRFGEIIGRFINVFTCIFANRIIFTDDLRMTQLLRHDILGIIKDKVVHIPVGPNIEPSSNQTDDNSQKSICFFGLVHPSKNVEKIIDAFCDLMTSNEIDETKLYIIGHATDDSYRLFLQKYISNTGQEKNIILTGYLSDENTSQLLRRMEFCILPYDKGVHYSTSGVVSSCILHKLPMIGTVNSANKRYPGMLPIQLPVNTENLREAMKQLILDKELLNKLKEEINSIKETRSWENISLKYRSTIYEVVSK